MSNLYANLIPLTDRVIIKPHKLPDEVKIGSIIVVTSAKDKPQQGTVVAKGQGRFSDHGVLLPMTVHLGDTVVFNQYAAAEFDFEGEKLYMLHENELSCILKPGTA